MRRSTGFGWVAGLLVVLMGTGVHPGTAAAGAEAPAGSGHRLAFTSDDRTKVRVFDVTRRETEVVFASSSSIQTVSLSPDGTRVAWLFYSGEDIASNRILVATVGSDSAPRNVLSRHRHRFGWIDTVAWSPSGRRLAFVARGGDDRSHLWTIRRNGRGLQLLHRNAGGCPDNCGSLVWSPDGSRVAWYSEAQGGWRSLAPRSGRIRKLHPRFIDWTPSGRRIVVALGFADGDKRIVTMRPDGAARREVIRDVPLWGSGPFEAAVGRGNTLALLWETPENDDPEYYTSVDLADGTTRRVRRDLDSDTGDAFDWR